MVQDLKPAAIWESGQGWVPLTMMNLINKNDQNSEDPNGSNQSPKNTQRLRRHKAHRASRSGPTSRSPSPLNASTGGTTNYVSRSNTTTAQAPQKSSRHLEVPSAATSVYALQQPSLPSFPRYANSSQYQDYSLSNDQQWRSPPGDQQTYSQEFQSFYPNSEVFGTNVAPYDQSQSSQMSNYQQYPQQSYHTDLTHRQVNHPSDYNHQAISYEPFATSISMTQDASFNGLTQQQSYPPDPIHVTPAYGFAADGLETAFGHQFDYTHLDRDVHNENTYVSGPDTRTPNDTHVPSADEGILREQQIQHDPNSPEQFQLHLTDEEIYCDDPMISGLVYPWEDLS
jgi:hypothetical protein